MQGVFAPASYFSVDALDLSLMAATLGLSDLKLILSVELICFDSRPIARGDSAFKSQIKPNLPARRNGVLDRNFHRQTQPPVADRILCKATALPGGIFKKILLEHPKRFP